jgi:hypothetical protein
VADPAWSVEGEAARLTEEKCGELIDGYPRAVAKRAFEIGIRAGLKHAAKICRDSAAKERADADADPECFEEPDGAIALEMVAKQLEEHRRG